MSGKVQATARVQLTIEFAVGGQVWNADAAVEQVHKQALEASYDILRRGLRIRGIGASPAEHPTAAEVVGEPRVTAILVEAQR